MRLPEWLLRAGAFVKDMFEDTEGLDGAMALVLPRDLVEEPGMENGNHVDTSREILDLWGNVRRLGLLEHVDEEYAAYRALCAEAEQVSTKFTVGSLFRLESLHGRLEHVEKLLYSWSGILGAIMGRPVRVDLDGTELRISCDGMLLYHAL